MFRNIAIQIGLCDHPCFDWITNFFGWYPGSGS